MKRLTAIFMSTLLVGCVKSYDIKTLAEDDVYAKVWFTPDDEFKSKGEGEGIVLKVSNTSDTTMYIDWSDASFSYQMTDASGSLSSKTVPVTVFSKQEGLDKPIKIKTLSIIAPRSSKSGVYTLIPKMDFATSLYISEAKGYIFAPDKLSTPMKFKVNFEVCYGALKDGVMPIKCSKGSTSWEDFSVKGTVGIVSAQ